MAVAQVFRFQVSPGKQVEFMANVAEAKRMQEAAGAKVRVWNAVFAGADTNTVGYVVEHKDMAAFASFTDKMQADAAWQAFLIKAFPANPAGTVLGGALIQEAVV